MVLNIRVLTPDRIMFSNKAKELVIPSTTGAVGILENHARMITTIEDGGLLRMKLAASNKWTPFVLFGGVAEIDTNDVTIITNLMEDVQDVDPVEAKKEVEKTIKILEKAKTPEERLDGMKKLRRRTARLEGANLLNKQRNKDKLKIAQVKAKFEGSE